MMIEIRMRVEAASLSSTVDTSTVEGLVDERDLPRDDADRSAEFVRDVVA